MYELSRLAVSWIHRKYKVTDNFVLANGPFAAVFLGNPGAIEPIAGTRQPVILILQKH